MLVCELNEWSTVLSVPQHLHQTVSKNSGTRSLLVVGVVMEYDVVDLLAMIMINVTNKGTHDYITSAMNTNLKCALIDFQISHIKCIFFGIRKIVFIWDPICS